ncbi:glycosyltransferase family 2 protein [Chitinophagaceae bacterium LWZ2-11]
MKTTKKVLIIIPCYNEAENIATLLNHLHTVSFAANYSVDFAVINDCSKDNTAAIVRNSPKVILLDLPVNLGIGGAVQTGFKYAFANGYDFAIQVDGDGQHPADALPLLLQEAENCNCDVVIGSRFIQKEGFQSSFTRRLGINYFKWLNRFFTGLVITDSTSGFRLLNNKAIEMAVNYYPDKYPEPESIIVYALNGLAIKEIPVIMSERQGGVSSISSFSALFYMAKVSLGIFYTFMRIKIQTKWQRSKS